MTAATGAGVKRLGRWAVVVAGVLAALPLAAQQSSGREVPGRFPLDSSGAAPVVLRGDTVLFVPRGYGAFTATDRAEAIGQRLRQASLLGADSLTIQRNESATNLLAGDIIVMSVTDADAEAVGVARDALAMQYGEALRSQLRTISLSETLRVLAYGGALALIATIALIALLTLIKRAMARAERALNDWTTGRVPTLKITTLEILTASQIHAATHAALRALRLALILLLLYVYLPLVLGFFPWTAPYGEQLLSYVLEPLARVGRGLLEFLPNLAFIAVIVMIARYALVAIKALFSAVERRAITFGGFEPEWSEPTYKIVRFLAIAFVLVVVFPYLPGSRSEAFRGISIFLGLLVSLGSSSAIANIIAGTVLTYTRAFSVGDRVQIAETTGDVIAKSLLVTRIRTNKNVDVTIPNAMVLSSHVLNYSAAAKTSGLILHTTVTIGYDVPWRTVHELLIAAATDVHDVLADPKPFVLQTALGDFSVAYQLNAYTRNAAAQARLYSDLHRQIQERFNAAGVEIMSPNYFALRDGNAVTLPPEKRPAGYEAPSFRVARPEP